MTWQHCCYLHICHLHMLIEQYFFIDTMWNIYSSINKMANSHYSHFREFAKVYPSLQIFVHLHTFHTLDPIPFVHCCYLYWPLHFWSPHWHLLISSILNEEQVLPDPIYLTKLIYSFTLSLRLVTLTIACLFDTCHFLKIIVYLTPASSSDDVEIFNTIAWHCHHLTTFMVFQLLWWCLSY